MNERENNARDRERELTEGLLDSGINAFDPQIRAKVAVLLHRQESFWDPDSNRSFLENLTVNDLYVVTFAYILGGWKCMVSSDTWTDTSYYEVTYDTQNECMYLDWYKKVENAKIVDGPVYKYKMACLRERRNRKKD